jgi:hypothetical protein
MTHIMIEFLVVIMISAGLSLAARRVNKGWRGSLYCCETRSSEDMDVE